MKSVRCSECGTELPITRKAMPKFGIIVDIVPPHQCPEEPVEFNPAAVPPIMYQEQPKGKFVSKLNDLQPPPRGFGSIDTNELRDRRDIPDSMAPPSLLKGIRSIDPTIPEGEIDNEPDNEKE